MNFEEEIVQINKERADALERAETTFLTTDQDIEDYQAALNRIDETYTRSIRRFHHKIELFRRMGLA